MVLVVLIQLVVKLLVKLGMPVLAKQPLGKPPMPLMPA